MAEGGAFTDLFTTVQTGFKGGFQGGLAFPGALGGVARFKAIVLSGGRPADDALSVSTVAELVRICYIRRLLGHNSVKLHKMPTISLICAPEPPGAWWMW